MHRSSSSSSIGNSLLLEANKKKSLDRLEGSIVLSQKSIVQDIDYPSRKVKSTANLVPIKLRNSSMEIRSANQLVLPHIDSTNIEKSYLNVSITGELTKRNKSTNPEHARGVRMVKRDALAVILAQADKKIKPVKESPNTYFQQELIEVPRLDDISEIAEPFTKITQRKLNKLNRSESSQIRISKDLYLDKDELDILKKLREGHSPKKNPNEIRSTLIIIFLFFCSDSEE